MNYPGRISLPVFRYFSGIYYKSALSGALPADAGGTGHFLLLFPF